jgi:pimeloyl-ACP methyl ester carboxylesterase
LTVKANEISFGAMATSYLQREHGRIGYDVQGTGPLAVCLPGMGDLRSTYRFTVPALVEAGYRVATMDLRGHGDSDDGFPAYDDVAAGQDLLALIDELGGGPALVLGNSMGAGAAVWATAEAPGRISGLALFGPFVRNPKQSPVTTWLFRLAFVRPWGPAVWRMYLTKAHPSRPFPADQRDRIFASLRRGRHWHSFVRTTRTTHAPAEARLAQVRVPTLVVMGTKDPDWPDPTAEARFVADALRGELLLVPGAGHYPMAEFPAQVNPALIAFAATATVRA